MLVLSENMVEAGRRGHRRRRRLRLRILLPSRRRRRLVVDHLRCHLRRLSILSV